MHCLAVLHSQTPNIPMTLQCFPLTRTFTFAIILTICYVPACYAMAALRHSAVTWVVSKWIFVCSHHFHPFCCQRHFSNSVFFIITTVIIDCNTLIVITREVIDQGSEHLPASQAWEQPKNPLPGESQTPCLAL